MWVWSVTVLEIDPVSWLRVTFCPYQDNVSKILPPSSYASFLRPVRRIGRKLNGVGTPPQDWPIPGRKHTQLAKSGRARTRGPLKALPGRQSGPLWGWLGAVSGLGRASEYSSRVLGHTDNIVLPGGARCCAGCTQCGYQHRDRSCHQMR